MRESLGDRAFSLGVGGGGGSADAQWIAVWQAALVAVPLLVPDRYLSIAVMGPVECFRGILRRAVE